ncbi:hypothetical protein GF357_03560 [Candidatus Dojkabacteria bacterium]|nr:hypothetical protein [Candidatus Dojkabacteria bacterium]
MKLNQKATVQISPTQPFNFDATFFKPDHFTTDDHIYKKGIRWQTVNWDGKKVGVKFTNTGTSESPQITMDVYSDSKLDSSYLNSLKDEIVYRYNLRLDLTAFYKKYRSNKVLRNAIKNLEGMRPGHPSSLYEYLIIGTVLQNALIKRSIQMFRNLLKKYGERLEFDGQELLCMWDIGRLESVDEQELRDLKVGYRAKTIKFVDSQFNCGYVNELEMRDWEVEYQKETLLSLHGVGSATVWYLLFDVFHRFDVFEHISPWEQKIYSQIFFGRGLDDLASVDELLGFIDQFGEFKHLAVHYLWEDLWWRRQGGEHIDWFEKEIRT